MGSNRRLRRSQQQQPNPDITIVAGDSYRGKPKPVLLTEPTLQDLAPYGPQILQALRTGYEQGLHAPCVFVGWRGSHYAREHGLAEGSHSLSPARNLSAEPGRKPI